MLNYKELDQEFDQILNHFSKEDLENWLAFDAEREVLERLQDGETVLTYNKIPITRLLDTRESFLPEALEEEYYTLAA